jgi:hypothetical protein
MTMSIALCSLSSFVSRVGLFLCVLHSDKFGRYGKGFGDES